MIMRDSIEPKRGFLFVLGHMRCCTTALCHVLGNHPEIDGYFESHLRYRRRADLVRLIRCVHDATDGRMRGRFVLDKILHNYHISCDILNRDDLHVIVMLRDPQDSLASIIRMGRNKRGKESSFAEPSRTLAYYVDRLRRIQRDLDELRHQPVLLTAETLRGNPQLVLDQLSDYLQLSQPLVNEYTLFRHSGKRNYGDTSDRLRAGTILPAESVTDDIQLDREMVRQAWETYAACLESAANRCVMIS